MKKITLIAIAIIIFTFIFFASCANNTAEVETTTEIQTTQVVETTEVETTTEIEISEETTLHSLESFDYLQAYGQGAIDNRNQWIISKNIYFVEGKFYNLNSNEVIFELSSIPEMAAEYRLIGACTYSDETPIYITVKSLNNIWLLTVNKDLDFKFEQIANDAIERSETLYFDRTDRFGVTCNNDAVQYLRSIIYISGVTGYLVQIDIIEDGLNKKSIETRIDDPVLISDAFGVYWLEKSDIETLELTELIEKYNSEGHHPDLVVDRSGQYIKFGFNNA